jgi:hypothetical protein
VPYRRQASGAVGYALTRLTARAVGGALTTRGYQKQQRAAFQAWALAHQPLVAQLRAVLADPAAAADLRDLARQVEAGRVLAAGQEEHAGRLLAAATIFADWARERQDLVRSLRAALNDRAAGPILRGLALQVTHGTS